MNFRAKLLFFCLLCNIAGNVLAIQFEAGKVRRIIDKVNEHWQKNHKPETSSFWNYAVYHTGNMEAYFLTGNKDYLDYSEAWAIHNEWKGAKSDDRSQWKYKYGETDDYVCSVIIRSVFRHMQICII